MASLIDNIHYFAYYFNQIRQINSTAEFGADNSMDFWSFYLCRSIGTTIYKSDVSDDQKNPDYKNVGEIG